MCKIVKKKIFFSEERNKENIDGVDPFQLWSLSFDSVYS